jgi:hypothetical protein
MLTELSKKRGKRRRRNFGRLGNFETSVCQLSRNDSKRKMTEQIELKDFGKAIQDAEKQLMESFQELKTKCPQLFKK